MGTRTNRIARRLVPLAGAVIATFAFSAPATANAKNICVGPVNPSPAAGCDLSLASNALLQALDMVDNNGVADTVHLGPGSFAGPFTLNSNDGDRIQGAGSGANGTVISVGTATNATTMTLHGTPGARLLVSDVHIIRIQGDSGSVAVTAANVTFDRVHTTLLMNGSSGNGIAMNLDNATVRNSWIDMSGDAARGVVAAWPETEVVIEDTRIEPRNTSTFTALHLDSNHGSLVVRRSRIGDPAGVDSFGVGVNATSGSLTVEDTLVDMGTRLTATGIYAGNPQVGSNAVGALVRRSTVVGTASNQNGIVVMSDSSLERLDALIDSTVVMLGGAGAHAVTCNQGASSNIGSFNIRNSAFQRPVINDMLACAPAVDLAPVSLAGKSWAAVFTGPAYRDYTPAYGSPLVDKGLTGGVTSASLDLHRLPRLRDGDGAGTPAAVLDIGAIELQRNLPKVTMTVSATTALVGTTIDFTANATDPGDFEEATITGWNFGDGSTAAAAPATTHTFTTPGTYAVVATATDTSGATGTATATVTITAPVAPPAPPTASVATDKTAPKLTVLAPLRNLPFLRRSTALRAAPAREARALRLTSSERAKLTISIARKVGRRYVAVRGTQRLAIARGATRLAWGGRWGRATLAAGTYRLTFRPVDAAGNKGVARSVVVRLTAPPRL